MPPRTDRRAGFMLVEVLAALLVTAALVATILPFAGQLIGRWQTGQATLVQADAWMQLVARISDDVAEAVPVHEPGQPSVLAFAAGPRRIDFIRPALGSAAAGTLERVIYLAEPVAGGEKLVRRTEAFSGGTMDGGGSTTTLLDGPYTFRFAAAGSDGLRGSWADMSTMPQRLDLVVSGRNERRVPFSPVTLPIGARATVATTVPMLRQHGP